MAFNGRRVSVGTSATLIAEAGSVSMLNGITTRIPRRVVVKNSDATNSVDLGGPSVATGAGYELKAGEKVELVVMESDALYGVAASGTISVHVLEVDAPEIDE